MNESRRIKGPYTRYVMSICMIIILRLSHGLYLKQYENALNDLEETKLTKMNAEIRKRRWIMGILLTIALLVAVAGLVVFYIKVSR